MCRAIVIAVTTTHPHRPRSGPVLPATAVQAQDDAHGEAAAAAAKPEEQPADVEAPKEEEAATGATVLEVVEAPAGEQQEEETPTGQVDGVEDTDAQQVLPLAEEPRPAKRMRMSPEFVPGETCGSSEQVAVEYTQAAVLEAPLC